MADIMSKEKRSALMSKIKGQNTGIEKTILTELKKRRIRKFEYQPKMFGKPDFVFRKHRIAVFCDGNFWHGYRFDSWKQDLNEFWFNKISGNMKRDRKVRKVLKGGGWKVIRLWEHQIKKDPAGCVERIQYAMEGNHE